MNFQSRFQDDDEIALDMTPLIDMVFQMLIFFLLTTTFSQNVREDGLQVDLPEAKTAQIPALAQQMMVGIRSDGSVVVGGETLDDAGLTRKFGEVFQTQPDTMVIIRADRSVDHGVVVHVMDLAALAGLKKMAIGTEKKE